MYSFHLLLKLLREFQSINPVSSLIIKEADEFVFVEDIRADSLSILPSNSQIAPPIRLSGIDTLTKQIQGVLVRSSGLLETFHISAEIIRVLDPASSNGLRPSSEREIAVNHLEILKQFASKLGYNGLFATSPVLYAPNKSIPSAKGRHWGPRLFVPFSNSQISGDLNRLASWLSHCDIYGDVILADFSLDRCADIDIIYAQEVFRATLPSQLLFWSSPLSRMFSSGEILLPKRYVQDLQYLELSKKPMNLLKEFVLRKSNREIFVTKTYCILSTKSMMYSADISEEEVVPVGWWNSKTEETITEVNNKKLKVESPVMKPTHFMITIVLPPFSIRSDDSSSIEFKVVYPLSFSIDSKELQTTQVLLDDMQQYLVNEYVSFDIAEQTIALEALDFLENHGRHVLFNLPKCEHFTFKSINTSVMRLLTVDISNSSQSFHCKALLGCGMFPDSLEKQLLHCVNINQSFPIDVTLSIEVEMFSWSLHFKKSIPVTILSLSDTVLQNNQKLFNPRIFNPPLSSQRRNLIYAILQSQKCNTWIDAGCGNAGTIVECIQRRHQFPNLRNVFGCDINHSNIAEGIKSLEKHRNLFTKLQLRSLSLLHSDEMKQYASEITNMGDVDLVTCLEVIEHLPSIADATHAMNHILSLFRPRILIVSTPNYESNPGIRQERSRQLARNLGQSVDLNSVDETAFREKDHKFEFTRQQFRVWIRDIIRDDLQNVYKIEIVELGNKLPTHLLHGGATQVAIFSLINMN